VIRVYDTPALIKGVWIFNPERVGHRENLYGNMQEKLKVPDCFSRRIGRVEDWRGIP